MWMKKTPYMAKAMKDQHSPAKLNTPSGADLQCIPKYSCSVLIWACLLVLATAG